MSDDDDKDVHGCDEDMEDEHKKAQDEEDDDDEDEEEDEDTTETGTGAVVGGQTVMRNWDAEASDEETDSETEEEVDDEKDDDTVDDEDDEEGEEEEDEQVEDTIQAGASQAGGFSIRLKNLSSEFSEAETKLVANRPIHRNVQLNIQTRTHIHALISTHD
jgi:hypothetical protein